MNISGLLRSIFGELQPSDAKTLELQVGQIVKGVVLRLLSEQDALVNIGGVQVRARLETPLKQGEQTLLQVQPESANGQPVLKPLSGSQTPISEASMPELLQDFGMKDDAPSRLLVRTMQQSGISLTKESTAAFADVMKAKPAGADAHDWLQTAALAFRRGLPVSPETVGALRQVLAGPPMFELLQRLGAETEAAMRDAALPDGVRRQLESVAAVLREAGVGDVPAGAGGGAPPAGRAAPAGAAPEPAAAQQQAPAPGAAASPAAQGPAAAVARPAAAEPLPGGAAAQPQEPPAGDAAGGDARAASEAAAQQPAPDHAIGRMLKALGVEHERGIALRGLDDELRLKLPPEPGGPLAPEDGAPSADSPARAAGESLKGLLLSLVKQDELPSALKETMQQAIQQITGQQLLLTPDRTAPFAQVTLFVPFRDENGQQTASVHIQSRRGSRGRLDTDNCRLLFDLAMKRMGNTLLDVHVVNRVVSLNVHNDHPAVRILLEQYRGEITEALQRTGYQLLSLKFSPYPSPSEWDEPGRTDDAPSSDPGRGQMLKSLLQAKPYKGVDFRA